MSDWRYWITYSGTVAAESEKQAQDRALDTVYDAVHGDLLNPVPDVEVEEVGEGE